MKKTLSQHAIALLFVLLLTSLLLAACTSTQPESSAPAVEEQSVPAEQEQSAPVALDGAALLQDRCSVCHNLDRVNQAQKSADEWAATITRMVDKGAKLDQAEQEALIQFLAEAYP